MTSTFWRSTPASEKTISSLLVSGEITAVTLLSYQLPSAILSILSAFNHLPSLVMPTNVILYFSRSTPLATVCTDIHETSCSDDLPPNITTKFSLAMTCAPYTLIRGAPGAHHRSKYNTWESTFQRHLSPRSIHNVSYIPGGQSSPESPKYS